MTTDRATASKNHGPVVAGIDFSKPNAYAVTYAAAEADRHGLPLVLTHAIDPHGAPATFLALPLKDLVDQAERELSARAASLRQDFPRLVIRTSVIVGSPIHVLVDASKQASMLVVGSRGHGSFGQVLLGSIAWRVISRAHGPVVLVRPDQAMAEEGTGGVLVGVDGSETCGATVDFAFAEAQARGLGLVAVTVWALPEPEGLGAGRTWPAEADDWEREMASDAHRILSEALAGKAEEYPDVPVQQVATHGLNVALTLLEVAATEDAELVVVGGRDQNSLSEFVFGAVALQLAHHADRSVAIVHT